MINYVKLDKDSRIERVIAGGRIIGIIIRGRTSAYFKSRDGWGKLFPDASVARAVLERSARKAINKKESLWTKH